MTVSENILLVLAYFVKYLKLPHLVKHVLFFLYKGKKITTISKVIISEVNINLTLGNFVEYWTFMEGVYERPWVEKSTKFVKGKTFIDIGANIGTYSLALSREAKQIYALEPEKNNYSNLIRNVKFAKIKNIVPIKNAVGSSNKTGAKLYIHKDDAGWHSLTLRYPGKTQKVNLVTVDSLVKKYNIKNIGLVKIDVEGAEPEVLSGSINVFKKFHSPVLIELNRPRLEISGYNINIIYSFFKKLNYLPYLLQRDKLIKIDKEKILSIYNQNVFFIPKASKEFLRN